MRKAFHWNEEKTITFNQLKEALVKGPVLTLPNFEQLFKLGADTSLINMSAILMQNWRPIVYFNWAFGSLEKTKVSVWKRTYGRYIDNSHMKALSNG